MHPPTFRATVAALAAGQLLCWALLYDGFSSFVLPMQPSQGWTQPQTMAAFTLGLAAWGATLYEPAFMVLTKRFRGHYRAGITALTLVGGFAISLLARAAARLAGAWALVALGGYPALLLALAALGACALACFALARPAR